MNKRPTASASIRDQQQYLVSLYGAVNGARGWEYLYGYVNRSAGYVAKSIVEGKAQDIHFVRALSWLFSLASKLGIDLEDALQQRFPGICQYCLERSCICYKTNKQPKQFFPAHRVLERINDAKLSFSIMLRGHSPFSFSEAIQFHRDLFPANEVVWHYAGPWHHLAKLHEEIAEVHEATSKHLVDEKPIEAVRDEVADVFGWLLSAWDLAMPGRSLDDAFVDHYIDGCPVCKRMPCQCESHNSRAAALVDVQFVVGVREQLQSLHRLLPEEKRVTELLESARLAEQTQHQPTAMLFLRQTHETAISLRREIQPDSDVYKQVLLLLDTIKEMVEKSGFF